MLRGANVLDAASQFLQKFPVIISHGYQDVLSQPPCCGTDSAEHNIEQPDVGAKGTANLIHDLIS
jgi:hypothetical protein